MKKLKILLLAASGWILPHAVNAQSTTMSNAWTGGSFLGWTNTNSFRALEIHNNGMTRMQINGNREWNNFFTDFGNPFFPWLQGNYGAYGMGNVGSSNNPQFYVGLGDNNGVNGFLPRTRLHVQGNFGIFGPGTGYRPWMQTGVYMNEFSNHMYVGMYKTSDSQPSDAVVNWGDDPGINGKRLRFIFTPTIGILPTLAPQEERDREVMSFWPTRVVNDPNNTTENIGAGDFINFTNGPQSHFHIHNSFGHTDFLQVSTMFSGFTAADGLRLGIRGATDPNLNGTDLIYQQEDRPLLMSTGSTNNTTNVDLDNNATRERVRLMQTNTPTYLLSGGTGTYNPANLANNNTRMSISIDPTRPVTRPLSLLHLGYNTIQNEAGWRPWMELGIFNANNASATGIVNDHAYFGFKSYLPFPSESNDVVIGWGNDAPNSFSGSVLPDNLTFVFTSNNTGTVNGPNSINGQEIGRFTPNCPNCPVNTGSLGIGDYTPLGGNGPGTTTYIGATLDVNGDARIRTVPNDNTLTQVLVIDPNDLNRIHWRDASTIGGGGNALGNNCGANTNPLNNDWEIPMNTHNFIFDDPNGTLQYGENFVGIGTGCTPGAKLDVLLNPTSNSLPTVTAARIINHDASGLGGTANGVFVETDGNGSQNNHGAMVTVRNAPNNTGIRSECMQAINGNIAQNNRGLEGIAHEGGTNIGVTGEAFSNNTGTTQNIGGRFIANQGTVGNPVNLGVYCQAPVVTNVNWALWAQGDVNITGQAFCPAMAWGSDKRFKTNINEFASALEKLSKVKGYTYEYKQSEFKNLHFPEGEQIGYIAQELKETFPQLVTEGPGGYNYVNYVGMIPVLTEAIKEQQTIIEKQEADNKTLTDRLSKLEECINKLQLCNNNTIPTNSNDNNSSTHTTTVQLSNAQSIVLDQNVPNPFAEQTVITYHLTDEIQKAQMLFYNAEGKLINSVDLNERGKGQLNVFANDLSSGVYTYTLVVDGKIFETKRMIKE